MRTIAILTAALAAGCDCGGPGSDGGSDSDGDGGCVDQDGDGFGVDCPDGDDCRDDDPTIHTECPDCDEDPTATGCPCDVLEPEICYSGPAGTLGVGPCTSGLRDCVAGVWGPCVGEALPQDEEALPVNGVDDDCNGLEDDALCGEEEICGDECCVAPEVCLGAYCGIPGDCADDGECDDDSHCVDGGCVPYGEGETDEDCVGDAIEPIGEFEPDLQCEWTDDIVWVPPLVADLDGALDDVYEPEVIFTTWGGGFGGGGGAWAGSLVAISGETCEERWRTDAPALHSWSPISVGDFEGDGNLEIAAHKASQGIAVFDADGELLWETNTDSEVGNYGPATLFANLDGVGDAEVMLGLIAYDSGGDEIWRVDDTLDLGGWGGQIPLVADVDLDGEQEVVTGNRILSAADGSDEEVFDLDKGFPAVGDFDKSTPEPEIAVIARSGARIQTIAGDVIFGPYTTLMGAGFSTFWGGPPAVADFDGDGEMEFGAAGPEVYAVFDPDCEDGWARDGVCAGGADGILWEKETHDYSSGATGSSVFDFDADGVAEVVYNDECFTRIYDGQTGETRFIRPNYNGTAYEYPTIADVDGDGNTEIVVSAFAGGVGYCPAADTETGEAFVATTQGVKIWRDVEDRWAPSRRMWNQHAYSVTNVFENGSIPDVPENNWDVAGLNNFRVNTQDDPTATEHGVDLTVRGEGWTDRCPERIELRAVVANRGTREAPRGLSVGFYSGAPPELGGELVCETRTEGELPPGDTEEVACDWLLPGAELVDIYVRVDDRGVLTECEEDNNDGIIPDVQCEVIG